MKPCPEYDLLLVEDAAGALAPAEAARVAGHLAGCAPCRAERAALAEALGLAALPPVTESERRALEGLPAAALAGLRRGERRRTWLARSVLGAVAACAAALLVFGPPEPPADVAPTASLDSARPSASHRSGRAGEEPVAGGQGPVAAEGQDRVARQGSVASLDSARPSGSLRSGRAEEKKAPRASPRPLADPTVAADPAVAAGPEVAETAGEIPSAGDTPRAAMRVSDAPTSSGMLAPAAVGETGPAQRDAWQGPDLDTLWEDTAVLDMNDGGLDL